jgi:hypothetical protein
MLDEDVSTIFSANCEQDIGEIVLTWTTPVPLQTVGVRTDMDQTGRFFSRDPITGEETQCTTTAETQLDGFQKCEMWTDNLVIQTIGCSVGSGTPTFDIIDIGAFVVAEAASWGFVAGVQVGEDEPLD